MKVRTPAIVAVVFVLATSVGIAAPSVKLTVTPLSFTFPSGDPDTTPTVSSPTLSVHYELGGAAASDVWYFTVRGTDLVSGSYTIPASNVSWTAPAPLVNGTLSNTDQTLATGKGNVKKNGSVTFTLQNLWTYKPGTYTQTITFTMACP